MFLIMFLVYMYVSCMFLVPLEKCIFVRQYIVRTAWQLLLHALCSVSTTVYVAL